MVLHGIAWYCIVLHSTAWYCMVLHGEIVKLESWHLDFGALAIIISLFGKADRQVKETNDRGSNQLVEHVSVKQLPWPHLAIWFIRNFLTIFFLSSSRCSLHFIYFSNVFGWGYIKLSACWGQLLVQLPDNLSLHREEILVLQVMYWHTMVGALTNISGHFGTLRNSFDKTFTYLWDK